MNIKIVAWNLAHQTQERQIKSEFVDVIAKINPDILTLNEYVHGETRFKMLEDLYQLGLKHIEVSTRTGKNNQILIASKFPLKKGDLSGPETEDGAGESNFLHVIVECLGIDIVGIRAHAYSSKTTLHSYWNNLIKIIRFPLNNPVIYIGDFNADPYGTRHTGASYLLALKEEGWQIPSPRGEWSYISGTRIDHALVSNNLIVTEAEYIASIDDLEIASKNTITRLSDHAPLIVCIENS